MNIQNYSVPQEIQDKMRSIAEKGNFTAKSMEHEIIAMGAPEDVAFRIVDSALQKFKRAKLIEFRDRAWHPVALQLTNKA
jgi:hypothetical protein